jgi:Flp pilus assembly protein TadD
MAAEINPEDASIFSNLGIAYELARDYEKAREAYERAIMLNPKSAATLNNLAGLTHRLGNRNIAALLYESAISSDPLYIEPYLNIARMFMDINAFHMAEPYVRKILQIEPQNAEALNLLGVITSVTERTDEAVVHFQNAVRQDGNEASFFSNLGAALRSTGDVRRAILAFEKAAEIGPNSLSVMNNLGVLYRETGDFNRAEHYLLRAAQFYPENPFPHFNLAELYISREDYNTALEHLKRYVALVPLDLDTLFKISGIARLADRLEDVADEMESFVREAPPDDPRRDIVRQWLARTKTKK